MTKRLKPSAKNVEGDFGQFTEFMKQLVSVPHTKIKAALQREKRTKQRKRATASPAFPDKD